MIRVQQESIDALKQMLSQLIKEKKMNGRTPSKKSKDKQKEGESSSSSNTKNEEHPNYESPNIHLKRRITQKTEATISVG